MTNATGQQRRTFNTELDVCYVSDRYHRWGASRGMHRRAVRPYQMELLTCDDVADVDSNTYKATPSYMGCAREGLQGSDECIFGALNDDRDESEGGYQCYKELAK